MVYEYELVLVPSRQYSLRYNARQSICSLVVVGVVAFFWCDWQEFIVPVTVTSVDTNILNGIRYFLFIWNFKVLRRRRILRLVVFSCFSFNFFCSYYFLMLLARLYALTGLLEISLPVYSFMSLDLIFGFLNTQIPLTLAAFCLSAAFCYRLHQRRCFLHWLWAQCLLDKHWKVTRYFGVR